VTATNGVEALDVLSKEVFDVVLMDLHMPVMDGIEAVKRLRAREDAAEKEAAAAAAAKIVADAVIASTAHSAAKEAFGNELLLAPAPSPSFAVDASRSCPTPCDQFVPRNIVIALSANCSTPRSPTCNSRSSSDIEIGNDSSLEGFDYLLEKPLNIKELRLKLLSHFSEPTTLLL
jgi:CheY-like chemotaxis protein